MNKIRRKRLAEAYESIQKAQEIIEEVKEEEEESCDNLPDSFRGWRKRRGNAGIYRNVG